MKKILSLGSVTVDVLMHPVDSLPPAGVLQGVEGVRALPGGCAVNAALDLHKLGAEVTLSCLIGDDPFGRMLLDYFEEEGLPTNGVIKDKDVATTVSVVLINSTGERSFLYYPGSAAKYTREHISDELVKELQNHVKKATAPYKYPRIVEFVDELPKTTSGKIRRVEIRNNDNNK